APRKEDRLTVRAVVGDVEIRRRGPAVELDPLVSGSGWRAELAVHDEDGVDLDVANRRIHQRAADVDRHRGQPAAEVRRYRLPAADPTAVRREADEARRRPGSKADDRVARVGMNEGAATSRIPGGGVERP